ncbi:hypothetical protein HPB50_004387 [Hyalomma asiaticum]|uniref:Uncharacterized protein n=1 Tax=Hyalomma asiaticum TaxID=266040 RepID=A0ACB7RS94_HYAAI|nr:hypothetical protein HPB50_004387 [Hyalomma asiaticum]
MWKAESIQKLESSGAALAQSVELILDVQERFATVPNGPVADRVTSKLKHVLDKNPGFYVLKQVSCSERCRFEDSSYCSRNKKASALKHNFPITPLVSCRGRSLNLRPSSLFPPGGPPRDQANSRLFSEDAAGLCVCAGVHRQWFSQEQ